MSQYRYQFEKGSKKHHCPVCHKKRFVRYIDTHTGDYLPIEYGKCDREINCGYHLNPYKNGYAKNGGANTIIPHNFIKPKQKPKTTFIPLKVLEQTRKDYEQNTFIQNLLQNINFPFEPSDIEKVIAQYHLGTITKGYHKGAVTFPFIDINNNVRTIQVKQFDKSNHTIGTDFLHSMLEKQHKKEHKPIPQWLKDYQQNDIKVSCLFGEHLLRKYPNNPIALVEAPKTAIYGTLYFGYPDNPNNFLWLAVYNLSSLNLNKCKSLVGRNVILFPDLSKDGKAFKLWSDKAVKIQEQLPNTTFKVANFLEQLAPDHDKANGYDLADYLIKLNWQDFREKKGIKQKPTTTKTITEQVDAPKPIPKYDKSYFENIKTEPPKQDIINWDKEIKELETFFKTTTLPISPIKLNQAAMINDVSKFIENHLATIVANNGNMIYLPYLRRLKELEVILKA
jgi:hypothetical protein